MFWRGEAVLVAPVGGFGVILELAVASAVGIWSGRRRSQQPTTRVGALEREWVLVAKGKRRRATGAPAPETGAEFRSTMCGGRWGPAVAERKLTRDLMPRVVQSTIILMQVLHGRIKRRNHRPETYTAQVPSDEPNFIAPPRLSLAYQNRSP
nr:hypothetical protein CFP56_03292 [Quercus suber]